MKTIPQIKIEICMCWYVPRIFWMGCRIEPGHYSRRADALRGAQRALRRLGWTGAAQQELGL